MCITTEFYITGLITHHKRPIEVNGSDVIAPIDFNEPLMMRDQSSNIEVCGTTFKAVVLKLF